MLAAGRGPAAPYAAEPIHRLVAAQAAGTPDSVAVACRGQSLRYAELDARSNRLAHHLVRLGVGRGAVVAISMERSADLLVAMLAVWKAGAAYVPVDPAYPHDRRAWMLDDSRAAVVLTDAASEAGIPATEARTVVIDRIDLSNEAETAPSVDVDASDLAYVIYTSGSTGRPKGVKVPHRGVANFLATMATEPGIKPGDVLVAVTTLSFDIAVLELLLAADVGAKLVIATRDEAMDAAPRWRGCSKREHVDVMQATPATWRMLAQAAGRARAGLRDAVRRRGAAAGPGRARCWPRGASLWNMYGPTETTVWSTVHRVGARRGDRRPSGRPIANTQVYVLDDAAAPVPDRRPRRAVHRRRRAWRAATCNRPELTAERFVADRVRRARDARLYRTGDLVRWRADGALEFLGRTRPPGEGARLPHRAGRDRGARSPQPPVRARGRRRRAREDVPGDARLVAYVVAADGRCARGGRAARARCASGCRSTWCRARTWCWTRCP